MIYYESHQRHYLEQEAVFQAWLFTYHRDHLALKVQDLCFPLLSFQKLMFW